MSPSFRTFFKSKRAKRLLLPRSLKTSSSSDPPSLIVNTDVYSICSICKNLDPSLFEIRELRSPRLRVDWDALLASNTCLSCSLLVGILRRYFVKFQMPPRRVRLVYEKTLIIEVGSVKEIMLYSTQATPWSSIAIKEHVKGPNFSEESLNYVKKMLQRCLGHHKACQMPGDTYLPTRLLDLECQSDPSVIRLWETQKVKACSENRYACLSHCWGKKQLIRTLKENLIQHQEQIHFEALPRTFTDAIDFTRRLGIRYIWIDSLCIVQDDNEDWAREAAQMSNVYQNCAICLASPGASNSGSGLYFNHPVDIEDISSNDLATTASHIRNGGQPWNIFAREPLDHFILRDPSKIPVGNNDHNPYTLRFRGWVYQERMLAPRFLHFLDQELAWDCRTESTCECDCQTHDIGTTSSMGYIKLAFDSELQSASRSIVSIWWNIVASYTKLYLTKETDRLLAIDGIAQAFQKRRPPGSGYFAGIWSDSAVRDLLWEVWAERQGEKPARNEAVPSWSWASVSMSVGYPLLHDDFEELCTIIIEMEEPVSEDPVSTDSEQTEKPVLTAYGFLLPAILGYRDKEEGSNLRPYTLRLFDATEAMSLIEDDNLHLPGPSHVQSGEIVYYLVMGKTPDDYYHSIILKAESPSENIYRRIGTSGNAGHRFAGRLSEKSQICIC